MNNHYCSFTVLCLWNGFEKTVKTGYKANSSVAEISWS